MARDTKVLGLIPVANIPSLLRPSLLSLLFGFKLKSSTIVELHVITLVSQPSEIKEKNLGQELAFL